MTRTLIPLAGLLLLAGCKSHQMAGSSAPSTDYDYAARDDSSANYRPTAEEDTAVVTGATASVDTVVSLPGEAERPTFAQKIRERRAARQEMASPAPAAPPESEPVDGEGMQPDGAALNDQTRSVDAHDAPEAEPAVAHDDEDVDGRHIVYTAAMRIAVFNLDEAMLEAETLPESYGGYVSVMQQGHLVVRIPSKHLRTAMNDLAKYGTVEDRSLQALDVTAEFTDLESRIRALTETQTQLLDLLSKARTVNEALEVRRALDQINTELEVLKGRVRQLSNQITYSTLTIHMFERGPHDPTPSSNDPFPWVNHLGVESTEYR